MLKYKCIFQIKCTLEFHQTARGNCYGSKLPQCWLHFKKKIVVLFMTIVGTLSFPIMSCVVCIFLFRNSQLSTLYSTVKSRTEMTINNHNRKVSGQCTDRYFQRKQGTVLNITGSYKYTQLIQQLVRSLGIRVKKHTNYKNKRKIMNTHIARKRAGCKRPGNVTKGRSGSG